MSEANPNLRTIMRLPTTVPTLRTCHDATCLMCVTMAANDADREALASMQDWNAVMVVAGGT